MFPTQQKNSGLLCSAPQVTSDSKEGQNAPVMQGPPQGALIKSLFDLKSPSAIKITDQNATQVSNLLLNKVAEGWRWITNDFINDDNYHVNRGYGVIAQDQVPDNRNEINSNLKKLQILSDPVSKARQPANLAVGAWIIMQGKTLHLIEASQAEKTEKLQKQRLNCKEGDIEGVVLTKNFFQDSYVRLAGAYIRRLERLASLEKAFNVFFNRETIVKQIHIFLGDTLQSLGKYNSYDKVTVKNNPLTPDEIMLLKNALGIRIDQNKITPSSTIENTVPFKKLLEILTAYNKNYKDVNGNHVPILVCFKALGTGGNPIDVEIMLSAYGGNKAQLAVSSKNPVRLNNSDCLAFESHAYEYWLKRLGSSPAKIALTMLECPFADSEAAIIAWLNDELAISINEEENLASTEVHLAAIKLELAKIDLSLASSAELAERHIELSFTLKELVEWKTLLEDLRNAKLTMLMEFLFCTQVVEAHCTPGKLKSSRVPGMGKLARALIRRNEKSLGHYFNGGQPISNKNELYPMISNGGTDRGREAVNALSRTYNNFKQNARDYDMSEDSDVG